MCSPFYQRMFVALVLFFAISSDCLQQVDKDSDDANDLQMLESDKLVVDEMSGGGDLHVMHGERELLISSIAPCNGGAGTNYFYAINFKLTSQGGWNMEQCTQSKQVELGNAVNAFILDYGIGKSGIGDKISFLGEVCNNPTITYTRRVRDRRQLRAFNFAFYGGGPCRYCLNDNFDARRNTRGLLSDRGEERALQAYDANSWFNSIFKPEMQNTLRNGFINKVQPYHTACLGNGPTIDVTITQTGSMPQTSC